MGNGFRLIEVGAWSVVSCLFPEAGEAPLDADYAVVGVTRVLGNVGAFGGASVRVRTMKVAECLLGGYSLGLGFGRFAMVAVHGCHQEP